MSCNHKCLRTGRNVSWGYVFWPQTSENRETYFMRICLWNANVCEQRDIFHEDMSVDHIRLRRRRRIPWGYVHWTQSSENRETCFEFMNAGDVRTCFKTQCLRTWEYVFGIMWYVFKTQGLRKWKYVFGIMWYVFKTQDLRTWKYVLWKYVFCCARWGGWRCVFVIVSFFVIVQQAGWLGLI